MKKIASSLATICFTGIVTILFISCDNENTPDPATAPVITGFVPNSGLIGSFVTIYGNNFIASVTPPAGPLANTSIIKFNGTIAVGDNVYQDSIGKQRINTIVPMGATSGKITVTANGINASSVKDFLITIPIYVPNVTVTTVLDIGGRGIAFDASGNLYVSDGENRKIVKITSTGSVTLLSTTEENKPNFGIAVDANDNVYAAVGQTIQKITPGGTVSTLAGSTLGYADGQGANAKFSFPWGVAVDASGNVYVSELLNNKIRKITPDGTVSTLAGGSPGYADGQGTNAKFSVPQGIAVDAVGNVFVADSGNNKIRKITPNGIVTTVAGSSAGYKDALGTTAQFFNPYGIALDISGGMYVADANNYVIRKITSDGNVTTVAGGIPGLANGSGSNAKFGQIHGVVLDETGNIYVADTYNFRIRKIVIN